MSTPGTLRIVIPLAIRRRNGRPRIVPPAHPAPANDGGTDPHVLRAIARAWAWRRRLEGGDAATISDIAAAEGVTDRYVARTLRLAYLAPAVLERLVLQRCAPAVSLKDLIAAAHLPWGEQEGAVFR